eukprot:9594214-Alexandrium_andersonii.AAC.1
MPSQRPKRIVASGTCAEAAGCVVEGAGTPAQPRVPSRSAGAAGLAWVAQPRAAAAAPSGERAGRVPSASGLPG